MATDEVHMIRIPINKLPESLLDELIEIWDTDVFQEIDGEHQLVDADFDDVIVKYFADQNINIKFHSNGSEYYDNDDISISEQDLTLVRLKYT